MKNSNWNFEVNLELELVRQHEELEFGDAKCIWRGSQHEELELEGNANCVLVRQHHEDELVLEGNANCISSWSWCVSEELELQRRANCISRGSW